MRETGLEPVRTATHAPQTCASADSATLAYLCSVRNSEHYNKALCDCQDFFQKIFKKLLLLYNQHSVTEREETVSFFYGNFISIHRVLIAAEGTDEHDESAFRQMEICDKTIDTFIFIAGVDEDACPALIGNDFALE